MRVMLLTFASMFFASVTPVNGQQSTVSARGIFLGGVAGAGWTRVGCDYCRRDFEAGPTASVHVGTHVRPGLRMGAELSGWTHGDGEEDVRLVMGALTAVAWLHPRPGGPFFVKGGLGWVTYRVWGDGDDDDLASGGPGIQLGAGWEFRLSEALTVSNFLHVTASAFGKLRSGETVVVDNLGVTSIQLGVGIARR